MRLFITVTPLLLQMVLVQRTTSASTGEDAEIQGEQPVGLEQQIANILTVYRQDFNKDLESIRSQLQTEQNELQSEVNDLKAKVETLQLKLKSVSEANDALKTELLSFFKKMSKFKTRDRSSHELKSQEAVLEEQRSTEKDAEHLNSSLMTAFQSEDNTTDTVDDESHVTLSIITPGGVSYTRWGRTTCEGDANVLYSGFVGKKRKPQSASWPGSDYICLHNNPQWGASHTALRDITTITGLEYGPYINDIFSKENNGGQPLGENDVPCTVCQVDTRSNQLMIPGRKSCPTGWTLEYWGYLVNSNAYSTEHGCPYLCLDQAPEVIPGGSADAGLSHIYPVEAYCMGVLCPPYVHGYEVTCAVCSK